MLGSVACVVSSPRSIGSGNNQDSAGNRLVFVGNVGLAFEIVVKKLKHEVELVKAAILAGMKYGVDRGAVVFEPTDSAQEKILFIYRLLVHDKVIQPLPEDQVSQQTMKHKLAIWHSKQLPKDHPLLK